MKITITNGLPTLSFPFLKITLGGIYPKDPLTKLTLYQLIEVVNGIICHR